MSKNADLNAIDINKLKWILVLEQLNCGNQQSIPIDIIYTVLPFRTSTNTVTNEHNRLKEQHWSQ